MVERSPHWSKARLPPKATPPTPASERPFPSCQLSAYSQLRRPVEILEVKPDRIEPDRGFVLWRRQRHRGDAPKALRAGFLAVSVALIFGPVDLVGLAR